MLVTAAGGPFQTGEIVIGTSSPRRSFRSSCWEQTWPGGSVR